MFHDLISSRSRNSIPLPGGCRSRTGGISQKFFSVHFFLLFDSHKFYFIQTVYWHYLIEKDSPLAKRN
jgi:hypothetical protein